MALNSIKEVGKLIIRGVLRMSKMAVEQDFEKSGTKHKARCIGTRGLHAYKQSVQHQVEEGTSSRASGYCRRSEEGKEAIAADGSAF
ncbi:MAG: hypothetical protein FRX49_06040 [Trebouxia sp. A1-2]|nr:MAG: hypothetical protein FRX49_06040 [Trebouxia sp. A1-2]